MALCCWTAVAVRGVAGFLLVMKLWHGGGWRYHRSGTDDDNVVAGDVTVMRWLAMLRHWGGGPCHGNGTTSGVTAMKWLAM